MVKKILITSYYDLRESLLLAAQALMKYDMHVVGYPLMQREKEMGSAYLQDLHENIKKNNIDVILWWHFSLPTKDVEYIVTNNPDVKNIYFNWDEPYNWIINDNINKAKYLDCAFITCEGTTKNYTDHGSKQAVCLYPGFDPNVHHPHIDDPDALSDYECDISICCTNLYDNLEKYPDQYIERKKLIDTIYSNQDKYGYKFSIYGSEKFRDLYPKSYRGFIKYNDTGKLFAASKINICTHVLCNKYGYLNERNILIMASGGLLFVDPVDGIDKILGHKKNCFIFDRNIFMEQIIDILKNYGDYYLVRYNALEKSKEYTWDKWAQTINNEFIKNL